MTIKFLSRRALWALLVVALYFIVQSPGLSAPFSHGDDQLEVAFVNGLQAPWQLLGKDVFGLFRPVKNILFAYFSCLSAVDVILCRITAIVIGLFSFLCIWRFFARVIEREGFALLAASVWLLSPTLVSSVAWLSCVNIQLMCAFVALAGLSHLGEKPGRAVFWILLACFSYEQAVVAGPCLILLDFFLRPDRLRERRSYLRYALYAAATVAYLVVRTLVGSSQIVNGSFVGCTRFDLTWASAYLTGLHFSTWFWPFGRMAVFGGYSKGEVSHVVLVACWLLTFLLLGCVWYFRKRRTLLALGFVWAWVAFLPLGNLAGLRNGPYGDYYLGLSSMGFAWACVALIEIVLSSARWERMGWLLLMALVFGVRILGVGESFLWARQWANPEMAYRSTIRTFPNAYFAHVTLARYLCDHGRFTECEAECDAAEALMAGEQEKLASIHLTRALVAMLSRADADEAEKWIDLAAREDLVAQNSRLCHFYRGCVLEDLRNDLARAELEYAAAIPAEDRWDADTVRAADRYARLLAIRGELERAIALWMRASEIAPADSAVSQNLRTAKEMLDRLSESPGKTE